MRESEETEEPKQSTKKHSTAEMALVVVMFWGVLALAALFFFMRVVKVLDDLH